MPIAGACVYSAKLGLVFYTSSSKKKQLTAVFENICITLAHNMDSGKNRRTLKKSPNNFHVLMQNNTIYMCIADEDEKLRICYGLLETLAEVTTPFVNSLDKKKIISLIKEKLDEFNDPNSDAISRVRAKVDDVKNQMVDNIDEIVKNLDKLQDIAVTSDDMAQEAQGFRRTTQKVKCSALVWWLTLVALLVAIILAVIIVIIIVIAVVASKNRGGGDPPVPPKNVTSIEVIFKHFQQ